MTYNYYRQPRYFGDFHCIGSACQDNCCWGWNIEWSQKEIDKLKSAENCSPELRELIEKSFFTNNNTPEGMCLIAFGENKRCPFLTEDSLCRIQKELGAEYMSNTCMVYPRKMFGEKQTIHRNCYTSCREVIRRLINDEKAMDLVNVPIKKGETLNDFPVDSAKKLAKHPELKYRGELLEFFYEIIADKRHDVETNIILGALAAQALTKLVNGGEADKIPETIKSLKSQMHNGAQLKAIENIKPNYHLRFGFIGKALREVVGYTMINSLNDDSDTPNIDYYNLASSRLNETFKDRPFYLRNIALNILLEICVPLRYNDKTIFENYSLFAVVFACIKLNMISLALTGNDKINLNVSGNKFHYDGEDKFVGLTAMISRSLCQSKNNQIALIDLLKEHKFTTPAYIALLVK